ALTHKLSAHGIEVRNVVLPAKDANEIVMRDGRDELARLWRELTSRGEQRKEKAAATVDLKNGAGEYVASFSDRTYRVRGLSAFGVDRLRVTIRVEEHGRFHIDTFDLYSARGRRSFIEATTTALQL